MCKWNSQSSFNPVSKDDGELVEGCDYPCLRVESSETVSIKRDEVIAEPSAPREVVQELLLFCLAKALQVKLQLDAERTHRSVSCTGFLAVLLDGIVLPDAC